MKWLRRAALAVLGLILLVLAAVGVSAIRARQGRRAPVAQMKLVEPLDPRSLRALNFEASESERKAKETFEAVRMSNGATLYDLRKWRSDLSKVREDAVPALRNWPKRPEFDEARDHMTRALRYTEDSLDYLDAYIADKEGRPRPARMN